MYKIKLIFDHNVKCFLDVLRFSTECLQFKISQFSETYPSKVEKKSSLITSYLNKKRDNHFQKLIQTNFLLGTFYYKKYI